MLTMTKKRETRGRKKIPRDEKKKHVQVFIKKHDVDRFGGYSALQKIITAFCERAEIGQKSGSISFVEHIDEILV